MRLHKIIELLQNSLGNSEQTIFKIGINTKNRDDDALFKVAEFEYHIYITFQYSLLSEVSIFEISKIYEKYDFTIFKKCERGLCPLGYENYLFREAKTFKITQIEDINGDLNNTFNKMSDKYSKICEKRKKESCTFDIPSIEPIFDVFNLTDIDSNKDTNSTSETE